MKNITNKNRGMFLEEIINKTITIYKNNDIAIFHKKNLDIKFSGIKNIDGKQYLKNGYIKNKSTIDYYGIYKGKFIAFEVKSTSLHSLPIKNIKDHQTNYLYNIHKHKGIAFLIIYFSKYNRFFIIFIKYLSFLNKKKSISFEFAKIYGIEIKIIYPGIIDFLEII